MSSQSLILPRLSFDDRALDPRRVLLHPAWLAGVALLAVNDHLLKGSGLLPGLVTGKLSDFAGLFIAPALFAAVTRVRSRDAFLAAHLLVGVVFSALQLSPSFAAMWSQLFAAFGLGWTTTMDPTDLIALAALVASYRMWTPFAMSEASARESLRRPWRRGATIGASAGGLAASIATSPPPDFEEWYPDISAQTFIHNESDIDLALNLRPMREDLQLDCDELALDPGGLLPDVAFDTAERWELPPRTSISAWTRWEEHECYAVMVSGDRFAPFIMFWDGDLPSRLIPGQSPEGSQLDSWGVTIRSDADGSVQSIRDTSSELSFVPTAVETQPGEGCELPAADQRLDWVGIDEGTVSVQAVEFGVDGCLRVEAEGPTGNWDAYICMPFDAFPFRAGDLVTFTENGNELTAADAGLAVEETRYLRLERSAGANGLDSPFFQIGARSQPGCGFEVDVDCAETAQRAELLVVGELGSATIGAGDDPESIALPDGREAQLYLPYASSRALLDASCADGSDFLGFDLDMVTLIQPAV